jgi:hypothetical protein
LAVICCKEENLFFYFKNCLISAIFLHLPKYYKNSTQNTKKPGKEPEKKKKKLNTLLSSPKLIYFLLIAA